VALWPHIPAKHLQTATKGCNCERLPAFSPGRNGGGSGYAYHRLFFKQKWIAIMKLSTLLLSSAALVVAGSAYAADLPAKKGAPAAKAATGCPAFGAGYFQIPGGDTCIKLSGYMRNTLSNDGTTTTNTAAARVAFTAMSTTELGALKGYTQWTTADITTKGTAGAVTADRAYVQVGGLSAGTYGSLFDISGSNGIGFGSGLGGDTGTGMQYALPVGAFTVTLGIQNPSSGNNTNSKGQDFVAQISTALPGGASAKIAAVSHKNDAGSGYAVAGQVGAAVGAATVSVYGGVSSGAIAYTGSTTNYTADFSGSNQTDGQTYGLSASIAAGPGSLYGDIGRVKAGRAGSSEERNRYGVGYNYAAAKNLTVQPEVFVDDNLGAKTNTFYLRINRDF
jgi:hypothetical protein